MGCRAVPANKNNAVHGAVRQNIRKVKSVAQQRLAVPPRHRRWVLAEGNWVRSRLRVLRPSPSLRSRRPALCGASRAPCRRSLCPSRPLLTAPRSGRVEVHSWRGYKVLSCHSGGAWHCVDCELKRLAKHSIYDGRVDAQLVAEHLNLEGTVGINLGPAGNDAEEAVKGVGLCGAGSACGWGRSGARGGGIFGRGCAAAAACWRCNGANGNWRCSPVSAPKSACWLSAPNETQSRHKQRKEWAVKARKLKICVSPIGERATAGLLPGGLGGLLPPWRACSLPRGSCRSTRALYGIGGGAGGWVRIAVLRALALLVGCPARPRAD